MKWTFEVNDVPDSLERPFIGQIINDNGSKTPKLSYTVSDVIEIISSMNNDYVAKKVDTFILPKNTIKKEFFGSKILYTLIVDKNLWDIKYQTITENHFIGFPKLIVQYLVSDSIPCRIISMRVAALKESDEINNETQLYKFPFPNVEKYTAKVCINLSDAKYDHSELHLAFKDFLAAPFNEDFGLALKLDKTSQFAAYLENKAELPFDDNELVPMNLQLKEF